MIMRISSTAPLRAQRGVALIVSLMFIVALTLIGVGAMNASLLELVMSSNHHQKADTQDRTEISLRMAEAAILNLPSANNDPAAFPWVTAGDQYYATGDPTLNNLDNLATWNTIWWADPDPFSPLDERYVVEFMGCYNMAGANLACPGVIAPPPAYQANAANIAVYRVFLLSRQGDGTARVTQSTFRVHYAVAPGTGTGPSRRAWVDYDL